MGLISRVSSRTYRNTYHTDMVRLTPQLIDEATSRSNPLKERELILRGLKFSVIENLGIALDAYDAYDLCDNDITKFDGFPVLKKAAIFYVNNNRISYIAGDLHDKLPNLSEISLVNNDIRSFSDIKRLDKCKKLRILSLTRNPVVLQPHYRLFVAYCLPSVQYVDFVRVKNAEREQAKEFFEETATGRELMKKIILKVKEEQETTFDDDEMDDDHDIDEEEEERRAKNKENLFDASTKYNTPTGNVQTDAISEEHRLKIKSAILKATSIEEVERLNRMLQAGYIPE